MSIEQISFWTWVVGILTTCGFAFWVGGLTERVGAGAILGSWLATVAVFRIGRGAYGLNVAIIDIILLVMLVALALKSSRYWPMWAAGFHLLAVVTHWLHELDPTLRRWTYVTAAIIWGYLPLFALAFGTWGAWRDRRQVASAVAFAPNPGATRR